jgi:hypothetical protein
MASNLKYTARCLQRKTGGGNAMSTKREILLETHDPEQMEAALFMLINEAEQAQKAMKWVHQ